MPAVALRRREGLRAQYRSLSSQKQWAIEHLHFAVPMHQTQLKWKQVFATTLRALAKQGLARPIELFEEGRTTPIPFWTLTQAGEEMRRAVFY